MSLLWKLPNHAYPPVPIPVWGELSGINLSDGCNPLLLLLLQTDNNGASFLGALPSDIRISGNTAHHRHEHRNRSYRDRNHLFQVHAEGPHGPLEDTSFRKDEPLARQGGRARLSFGSAFVRHLAPLTLCEDACRKPCPRQSHVAITPKVASRHVSEPIVPCLNPRSALKIWDGRRTPWQ